LLADWQSLSQQVNSLSEQAAQRFDDQLQATQSMAALLASTMATITDATTLAKRLQEKYVQQAVLQTGGGDAVWSCDRGVKLVAGFSIARCAEAAASPLMHAVRVYGGSFMQRNIIFLACSGIAGMQRQALAGLCGNYLCCRHNSCYDFARGAQQAAKNCDWGVLDTV
jgi:hypothetical protein